MDEIRCIREVSQYLSILLRSREDYLDWLWVQKQLYRRYPLTELYQDLQDSVRGASSFGDVLAGFRAFKQRHFLRIGGRDLLGLADLAETTGQLSDLASVAFQVGLNVLGSHPQWWTGEGGTAAWARAREAFDLVVMGLGKFGGHELNYVSDVDILYLYAPRAEEEARHTEAFLLLSRLGQWLARLLGDRVEGDRVFLVDLRLRPQGKDGPLIPSLAAATEHYLHCGRPWERQMLLKARPVAGDRSLGMAFLQEVRPFVFRRFLDFQALDELRAMRDRILMEAVRPRAGWEQFDVKLGIGGIREVEFLVQSLQLIYGGRHPELDEPNTLRCLDRLEKLRLLPGDAVRELKASYTFLRRVEHWVQLDQNRQTQKLPVSGDGRKRLALALGFEGDEAKFLQSLDACCTTVHRHFTALFRSEEADASPSSRCRGGRPKESGPAPCLDAFPAETLARLQSHLKALPTPVQERILESLTRYATLEDAELREKALVRVERYFGNVGRRPGLVKVFHASGPWVGDLCRGLAESELLAHLLAHHPSVVEGIATSQGMCPPREVWTAASVRLLESAGTYEEGLEWIRRLRNERLLQLTLADLRGELRHEVLEKELTALADSVVHWTYERILNSLELDPELPLSILGLGKLGSGEMSYHSDLDLVFVYSPRPGEPEDQIPGDVVRVVQRTMRMLSTPLHEGPGYAVDARLRPTGTYGPLIVTRTAWLDYYTKDADLWEIQALLRVRHVAGDRALGSWIEARARELFTRPGNSHTVWSRLCHLRQRMQSERSEERGEAIDIKLGLGGLADLEFLVQGTLLVEGAREPALWSRSVRDALPAVLAHHPRLCETARELQAAFQTLRSLEHRLRLQTNTSASRLVPAQFESLQAIGLWPPIQENSPVESWEDLLRVRRRVREALHLHCPDL